METLIIFGAKYLFLLSLVATGWFFYKLDPEKRRRALLLDLWALPLTYLLGLIARSLYYNPRPFVVKNFEPLVAHAPDNGFPSDHMLLLAALAASVSVFNRKLGAFLWLIAIAVGVSRVVAGVHHVLDIKASVVIGLLAVLIVHFVLEKRKTL